MKDLTLPLFQGMRKGQDFNQANWMIRASRPKMKRIMHKGEINEK